MKGYRLSDAVLAQLVRLLQEALLTGTDIADHLRMMRLESKNSADPEVLDLTDEYMKDSEERIKALLSNAEKIKKAASEKTKKILS